MRKSIILLIFMFFNVLGSTKVENGYIVAQIKDINANFDATVMIVNRSSTKLWLHKQILCTNDGFTLTNLFEIEDKKGHKPTYTWIEQKMKNFFDKESFIELLPGKSIECNYDLNSMYLLNENTDYNVIFKGFNPKLGKQKGFWIKTEIYKQTYAGN